VGSIALASNDSGSRNNAFGYQALYNNTTGSFNQAMGVGALLNNDTGFGNIAIGDGSLVNNVSGFQNTVVGDIAGGNIVIGDFNTYVGATVAGPGDESFTIRIADTFNGVVGQCFIGGIVGNVTPGGALFITGSGQLTTTPSSRRFKDEIKPMGKTSEAIFSLRPVTFRYKNEKTNTQQCGLIAEEVEKVNPALTLPDKEGKPYTVRYEQINAMLLNEFIKEHKKVEELEGTVTSLAATVKEQAAQIQRVSAQIEVSKPAAKVVVNKP